MKKTTQFGKAVRQYQYPLLIEQVNTDCYKWWLRQLHHVFPRASKELDIITLNFAHRPILAIYAHGFDLHRKRMTQAIDLLTERGFIEMIKDFSTNGYSRTYRRTRLFEKTFKPFTTRIRVLDEVLVGDKSNAKKTLEAVQPSPLTGQEQLRNSAVWATPRTKNITLTLSNGGQVFKDVVLHRVNGKRLYAKGVYNYQYIPKEERKQYLLINGEATTEIDFTALHGNLLLNREGQPSDKLFYERILRTLGIRNTKKRRGALKTLFCASLNIKSRQAFSFLANRITDDDGNKLIGYLNNIRPAEIYHAIVDTHPAISKYICTGDHSDWLQTTDSEIMIDILKSLHRIGVVALPLHDSCIVTTENKEACIRVMKRVYKKHMGFVGKVK